MDSTSWKEHIDYEAHVNRVDMTKYLSLGMEGWSHKGGSLLVERVWYGNLIAYNKKRSSHVQKLARLAQSVERVTLKVPWHLKISQGREFEPRIGL